MKSMSLYLLSLALLALFAACGKNNESGKTSWEYGNPYGQGNAYGIPNYNNPSVQALASQYHCEGSGIIPYGQSPYPGGQTIPPNARTVIQVPLTGSSIIASMQPYIGVTGYGDIAVITSPAPGQPSIFTAYLCPRPFSQSGQGQLLGVKVGANAIKCKIVPSIIAADVILPGGLVAKFRSLDGGAYNSCMGNPYNTACNMIPFVNAGLCSPNRY